MKRLMFYLLIIFCLTSIRNFYFLGKDVAKREVDIYFFRFGQKITNVFQQDPPIIKTGCWQLCDTTEYVTWEEYIRRYKLTMRDH